VKKDKLKTLSMVSPLLHLAIIMDGNRRWAKANKLAPHQGHIEGAKNAFKIIKAAIKKDIKELSLYTFSTQNWNRSKVEVSFIINGFKNYLPKYIPEFNKLGVKVRVVGSHDRLNQTMIEVIKQVETKTSKNKVLKLNILFNYGGDDDLEFGLSKIKSTAKLNLANLKTKMHSHDVSNIDLLIRTGGEFRVSNFLPLQLAYSEFYFTKINWPAFNQTELNKALKEYQNRQRRFGGN
jgi:undecaprenyl diphosphate synthase